MGAFLRWNLLVGAVCVSVLGGTAPAWADFLTAVDGNALIEVDPHGQAGIHRWEVDGVDHLFQEWVWLRIDERPEFSLDTLPLLHEELHGPDVVHLVYGGETTPLLVELFFDVDGGAPGSSTLTERGVFTNLTESDIDLYVFHYTDLDLNGSIGGDSATFDGVDTFTQTEGPTVAIVSPVTENPPDHWELGPFSSIRDTLNDGVPTTLADSASPFGPGDATFAYQFLSEELEPQESDGGAIVKRIHTAQGPVIPEPSSILLFGLGGLGAVASRRKRHTS